MSRDDTPWIAHMRLVYAVTGVWTMYLVFGMAAMAWSSPPELSTLLTEAGWEPVPVLSSQFAPGRLFRIIDGHHVLSSADCVAARPVEQRETSGALRALQTGVTVGDPPLVVLFTPPMHASIHALHLAPTDSCKERLQELSPEERNETYVVTDVLRAMPTSQDCANLPSASPLASACQRAQPLPIAYRSRPLGDWFLSNTTPVNVDLDKAIAESGLSTSLTQGLGGLIGEDGTSVGSGGIGSRSSGLGGGGTAEGIGGMCIERRNQRCSSSSAKRARQ